MGNDIFLRDSSVFVEARHTDAVAPILAAAGFISDVDKAGNITRMDFDGHDMSDDEELCEALAPFMRDGSFLEFCDEKGYIWRWVFDAGDCVSVDAVIIWPKPDTPSGIRRQIQKAFESHLMTE